MAIDETPEEEEIPNATPNRTFEDWTGIDDWPRIKDQKRRPMSQICNQTLPTKLKQICKNSTQCNILLFN